MNKIKMFLLGVFFLFFFGFSPVLTAKAYSIDEIGDASKVGQIDSNGYSHVGISISLNGEVKYYVVDSWRKLGDSWNYIGANYSGNRVLLSRPDTRRCEGTPLKVYNSYYYRFQIFAEELLAKMPSDYSLISKEWSNGNVVRTTTDYSFEDHSERKSDKSSLYYASTVEGGSESGSSSSSQYEFYTPITLGESENIGIQLPSGAVMTGKGKAYVSSGGYYIDKLPQISYEKAGYTVEFEGWYDQPSGGNKITERSILSGSKLYARYVEHVNPFKVTCYDIQGTDISGREIGKHVFDAYEGDVVSGADMGSSVEEGAYYEGLIYHSCTEKTVYSDTTVYRFFTHPYSQVTYVDQVLAETEPGEILGTVTMQKEIGSLANGEELGIITDMGTYYPGYSYSSASSSLVLKEGTTVYRYFKPHTYCIMFHGNGNTEGSMESMDCIYGEEIVLPPNSYEKNFSIHLDVNGENAASGISEIPVSQKFLGWSLSEGGTFFCRDQEALSSLTDTEEIVHLYAIWSEETVTLDVVPERNGYEFLGWSENLSDTEGNTQFTLKNDTTLYAIWKKETAKYRLEYDYNDGSLQNEEAKPKKNFGQEEELTVSSLPQVKKEGYTFAGWNTRADGSGVTIKTDSDLSKIVSEGNAVSLYAVWKPSEDTGFTLKLYKDSTKELVDTLALKGITGEKVSDALKRIYAKTLGEDQVWQFYEGYEIINKEILEELIKADGSTELTCYLMTRVCEITLIGESKEGGNSDRTVSEKLIYKDSYTLPATLDNGTIPVDRYRDSDGKTYEVGEKIILEKNKTFYVQHFIRFYSDGVELKDKKRYVDHGEKITLPVLEKKGYQFLGWKEKNVDKIYGGNSLVDVLKGYDLYAVWSEPNTYKISYEIEDHLVKIAENQVNTYQFGKETILPDKMQIIVEHGYEFKGWYLKDDPKQTIVTKISADQTGDIILKAKLMKLDDSAEDQKNTDKTKDKDNSENSEPEKDNANSSDDKTNTSKSDSSGKDDEKNEKQDGKQLEDQKSDTNGKGDGTQGTVDANAGTGTLPEGTNDSVQKSDRNNAAVNDTKKTTVVKKTNKVFQKGGFKYQIISKKKVRVILYHGKKSVLTIPAKISYQGVTYQVTEIGKKAFYKNKRIKRIVLSSGVKKINDSAFANMKKLVQATIGKNVTHIGKKAFYGNKKLKKVNILSKKLKQVKKTAFKGSGKKVVFHLPAGKKAAYKKFFK